MLEEFGKQGVNETARECLGQMFSEVRHGLHSVFAGAQFGSDLPPKAIGLATMLAQFGGCPPAEWHKIQQMRHQAQLVSASDVATPQKYVARILCSESSDPRLVVEPQQLIVRPICIWAGGETLTTG